MPVPHTRPFGGELPRRPFDERDPRALDLFTPYDGKTELPEYGLLGVPFDGAVLGRKGTAEAPAIVREALRYLSSYNFEEDVQLHGLKIADIGNIDVLENIELTHVRITSALQHLFERKCTPLVVGGDNSITYAGVRALAQAGAQRIGVLSLDAHLDVRVPEPQINSGCSNRLILERIPQVRAENVAVVGLRRFANSKQYRDWAEGKGMRLFPIADIRRRGFQGILEQAVEAATSGVDALYVSLDMDVVDQAWAPGVSSPSPDGLTPREVFDAITRAARTKVARAFDVVETAPKYDPTGNTARVAATAVMQFLVGRVLSTRPEPPKPEPAAATAQAPRGPPRERGPPMGGAYGERRGPPRERGYGPPRNGPPRDRPFRRGP